MDSGIRAIDSNYRRWVSRDSAGNIKKDKDGNEIASNFGRQVDIFAPGVDVFGASTGSDGSEFDESGTSVSTAFVAGIAALYMSFENAKNDQGVTVGFRLFSNAQEDLIDETNDKITGSPNLIANTGIQLDPSGDLPYLDAPGSQPNAKAKRSQNSKLETPVKRADATTTLDNTLSFSVEGSEAAESLPTPASASTVITVSDDSGVETLTLGTNDLVTVLPDFTKSDEFASLATAAATSNAGGTNVHMDGGCIIINGQPLCSGGNPLNIPDSGSDNAVAVVACFPADATDSSVTPSCQATVTVPRDFGDESWNADNCMVDAGGNTLSPCASTTTLSAMANPSLGQASASNTATTTTDGSATSTTSASNAQDTSQCCPSAPDCQAGLSFIDPAKCNCCPPGSF
ncbi:hypothetical protein B0A55_00386 [Friedmanniomyces simplex]|uniref:Peptidase S8/S53 domain-containing protein n=1 Tax=Friedmanniomyces simplex TaxID=329884 RepID=A0A4U0Y0F7_9PEZI|nr:hypothetical protein B0A55_00386 [Friedmanniomyces simplex]